MITIGTPGAIANCMTRSTAYAATLPGSSRAAAAADRRAEIVAEQRGEYVLELGRRIRRAAAERELEQLGVRGAAACAELARRAVVACPARPAYRAHLALG